MKYTTEELQTIAQARKRPIELTEAQFNSDKKKKRYDPDGYTFQKFNPGNIQEPEQLASQERKNVRVLPRLSAAAGQQLDLFHVENTNIEGFGNE